MQLRHHNTFSAVDHKSATGRHIGDHTQIDVLVNGLKIFVIVVRAGESQFGFERHAEGEAAFDALGNAIARGIDVIVEKFEHEIISRVGDGEVFREDPVKSFVLPIVGVGLQLEEVLERLQLNIEEVRIFERFLDGREADSFGCCCQGIKVLG